MKLPAFALKNVFSLPVLAGVFLSLFASAAHASFGIAPMETAVQAPVGGQTTNSISVTNDDDTPLHITASVMDWTLTPQGDYRYSDPGTLPHSCANWIQLNPSSFVVAPKQTVSVRYSVTTPTDFSEESRAMIFFKSHPLPVKTSDGSMSLNISMRVGCKVFVSPTSATPATKIGKITDMDVTSPAEGKIKVSFANTGTATFRVKGTAQARDAQGNLVATGHLMPENAQVLPQLSRDLWTQWDKPLSPGIYTFDTVLDYGAKDAAGGQLKAQITPAPPTENTPQ